MTARDICEAMARIERNAKHDDDWLGANASEYRYLMRAWWQLPPVPWEEMATLQREFDALFNRGMTYKGPIPRGTLDVQKRTGRPLRRITATERKVTTVRRRLLGLSA